MVDLFLLAAIMLLILGVIGSFTPMIPGAAFSVAGVLLYYWSTGFTEPGLLFTVFATFLGLGAFLADYFAGAVSARIGGASLKTALASGIAGFLLFFIAGPVGILIGVGATVFLAEFWKSRDARKSFDAALYSMIGLIASTGIQFLATLTILIGFLIAILL